MRLIVEYMRGTVVVVGSANQDIVVEVPRQPLPGETILGDSVTYLPGGKGLNQACAAAMTGTDTHFVGAVGKDASGVQLIQAMQNRGVNVSLTKVLENEASGTAHILVSIDGSNQIVVVPSANGRVSEQMVRDALQQVPSAAVLVLQGEIPFDASLVAASIMDERGGRVVFNLAPAATVPAPLLGLANPLVVNEFEAGIVLGQRAPTTVGEAVEAALKLSEESRSAIVTLGKLGSVVAENGETTIVSPTPVEEALDTTGAGDAFVGVLAAELAGGEHLVRAAEAASRAASATVTRRGASESYDVIAELY